MKNTSNFFELLMGIAIVAVSMTYSLRFPFMNPVMMMVGLTLVIEAGENISDKK